MRYCFIFIAFVSLLCSCKGTQPVDDADVLVKVKDRTLRRSEIKQQRSRADCPRLTVCCLPKVWKGSG